MSEYTTTTYTSVIEGQTINANMVRELLIKMMSRNDFITEEQRDDLLKNYVVVIGRKGWFGRTYDKIWKIKDNGPHYEIVKVV